MAFDQEFAGALSSAIKKAGWEITLSGAPLPNPLDIVIHRGRKERRRLIIHARRITSQSREGESPSTHNRPAGEMHTQMIFDGDQRGKGQRNQLRFADEAQTILLGFYFWDGDCIVAAYDPEIHRDYAYSKSLQLKESTLIQAAAEGIAFQARKNDETIVAFHIDEIMEYLDMAQDFHQIVPAMVDQSDEEAPLPVKRAIDAAKQTAELPDLVAQERKHTMTKVGHYIRNRQFTLGIKGVYDRCAICGFQYDEILDAAHIIPVSENGTDTYDNGLGLCPTCHRMFDGGFILVDETGRIFINTRYAEEYDQIGKAGSLEDLQKTLRKTLWLPEDSRYHPSAENLRRVFESRR